MDTSSANRVVVEEGEGRSDGEVLLGRCSSCVVMVKGDLYGLSMANLSRLGCRV